VRSHHHQIRAQLLFHRQNNIPGFTGLHVSFVLDPGQRPVAYWAAPTLLLNGRRLGKRKDLRNIALDHRVQLVIDLEKAGREN